MDFIPDLTVELIPDLNGDLIGDLIPDLTLNTNELHLLDPKLDC